MSKKMFYADALKVLWMKKHFSIEIVSSIFEDGSFEGCIIRDLDENGVFYIHPDSYGILEPKVGDLVKIDGENEYQVINYDAELFDIRHGVDQIIQRQGKAFFMPEVENEDTR